MPEPKPPNVTIRLRLLHHLPKHCYQHYHYYPIIAIIATTPRHHAPFLRLANCSVLAGGGGGGVWGLGFRGGDFQGGFQV